MKELLKSARVVTATELLKINTSSLAYKYQTTADDNGNYDTLWSIDDQYYKTTNNLFNF